MRYFLLVLLISIALDGASQADLPTIVPPAPETAALFRYQDYPMDHSTGLPQISIPIYEVKSGNLTVPISISYHASGCKVSDQDGPIAVGWSLNAGGMISRTIYGSQDFGEFGFPNPFEVGDLNIQNDLVYLQKIAHSPNSPVDAPRGSWKDSEYDIFSYTFNGISGKFIFKEENGVKTPVLIPYKPFVVTPHIAGGIHSLTSLTMKDDKGTQYEFEATELYGYASGQAQSGYSLKKIISSDKVDTIIFKYDFFNQERVSIEQQIIWNDQHVYPVNTHSTRFPSQIVVDLESTIRDTYQIARLVEIEFRQGKVVFNLSGDTDKVDNIQVLNVENDVIKQIKFDRSTLHLLAELEYATNKLDAIRFLDINGATVEKYQFEYYPTIYSGINDGNYTQLNTRYRDWWGYYNASGMHDMIPYYTNLEYQATMLSPIYNNFTIGNLSCNRNPNLAALKSGVLKSITYPTGGRSEFMYEHNKYFNSSHNQPTIGPGLRVSQIATTDNNGLATFRTFKYGINENDCGFIDLEPSMENMMSQVFYFWTYDDPEFERYRERTFHSSFVPEVAAVADRPVEYAEVTEYHGTVTNNIGKTIYNYDRYRWFAQRLGAYGWQVTDNNFWNSPSLVQQREFKKGNGLTYSPVKETINTYSANPSEFIYGLHLLRVDRFPQTEIDINTGLYPEEWAKTYTNEVIYANSPYSITTGSKNLTSTTVTIHNDDGTTINDITNYTYNDKQLISQTSRTVSDGSTIVSEIKYPFEFTGDQLLSQMTGPTLNMINIPVQQNELKNGTPIKSVKTNYFNWGGVNPMIAPQTIDLREGYNGYETRLRYHGYDNHGNPTSVSKENDALRTYLWDYKQSYPVAEIVNADVSKVAFTSFEADGTGNWTGVNNGGVKDDTRGITGKKYYNLSWGALVKSGLSTSDVYIISYWSRGGQCTVSGTPQSGWPKNLRSVTINGTTWNYWEHRVTGTASVTVSGSESIDEIRLYPSFSQMSTYTFEPLRGLTSTCDINNTISYYEYDDYGRLKLVKDYKGQILKMMNYSYQSETP